MHRKLTALAALAALAASAFASGGSSAFAGQPLPQSPAVETGIVLAQYNCAGGSTDCPTAINRYPHRYGKHRHYRGGPGWHRRHWRPHYPRRHVRPGVGIYFGRPPVPHVVPRYRHAPRVHLSRAHVNWCYNRYKSYRAWDNTFQPYHGPRRQCWSPYN